MPRQPRDPASFVTCRLCRKRFRAITCSHLLKVHKFEGAHPIYDYKAEFDLAYSMCRNSRKRISEATTDFWEKRGQHWRPDDVLAEIRRLHTAGKSIRGKRVPNSLFLAGGRLFGNWRKAVEACGFDYEQVTGVRHWTRGKVINEIRRLAATGVALNATDMKRQHPALHQAALVLFPTSWAKALRAAGYKPEEHKKFWGVWNRQSAERWVRERTAGKKPVLARDVPRDLRAFVYRRLEISWAAFVERITGQPYSGIKKRRDWTKERVLSEIGRLKSKGNSLAYQAVVLAVGQAIIHQARKFFGSWLAALAAAGV